MNVEDYVGLKESWRIGRCKCGGDLFEKTCIM